MSHTRQQWLSFFNLTKVNWIFSFSIKYSESESESEKHVYTKKWGVPQSPEGDNTCERHRLPNLNFKGVSLTLPNF